MNKDDVLSQDAGITGGEEKQQSISADLIRGHINTIILRSLYDDLIHNPVDSDLHTFRAAERLMRINNPFAGFIGRGEEGCIADLHSRDLTRQAHRSQDVLHGNGGITGENVL